MGTQVIHPSQVHQALNCWLKLFVLAAMALLAYACTPVQHGALWGGALGAGTGALIADDSAEGALIGAGIGAITGALAADYQEKYAARHRPVYVYDDPRYYSDQPYHTRYYQGYYEAPVISRHYYYDRPRYSDYHRHYYDRCCH